MLSENPRWLPLDSDGFAIPGCDILSDQLAECGMNDPNFGDPANWPWWVDLGRFELGGASEFIDLPDDLDDDNPF